jgi:hypothetical protein
MKREREVIKNKVVIKQRVSMCVREGNVDVIRMCSHGFLQSK